MELDYGEYDCRPLAEVPDSLWATWRRDPSYTPPGGESLVDVGRRVRFACEELAERAAATDVVVVSHVSPIKAAVTWALRVGDEVAWRMFLDLASITRISTAGGTPVLRSLNERVNDDRA